jgi:hypothetical protein
VLPLNSTVNITDSTPPLLLLGYVIVLETFQYGYLGLFVWHVLRNFLKLFVILNLVLHDLKFVPYTFSWYFMALFVIQNNLYYIKSSNFMLGLVTKIVVHFYTDLTS